MLLESPLPSSSLNALCTQICKHTAVNKVEKQARMPSQYRQQSELSLFSAFVFRLRKTFFRDGILLMKPRML